MRGAPELGIGAHLRQEERDATSGEEGAAVEKAEADDER